MWYAVLCRAVLCSVVQRSAGVDDVNSHSLVAFGGTQCLLQCA